MSSLDANLGEVSCVAITQIVDGLVDEAASQVILSHNPETEPVDETENIPAQATESNIQDDIQIFESTELEPEITEIEDTADFTDFLRTTEIEDANLATEATQITDSTEICNPAASSNANTEPASENDSVHLYNQDTPCNEVEIVASIAAPVIYQDTNEEINHDELDVEYVVEKILDKKIDAKGVAKYFVKWEGYPSEANTWEPIENLADCDKAMQKYEEQRALRLAEKYSKIDEKEGPKRAKKLKEYQLDDIIGLTVLEKEKYFVIRLKGEKEPAFMRASLANKMFPVKVVDFYLKFVEWKRKS